MKNYVVGILSLFENDLKLFKVTAKNEYEAVKQGMLDFCEDEEGKYYELELQNSENYPKTLEELFFIYEEVPFNVIEV